MFVARLQKAAEAFRQLNQRKKGKKNKKKGPAGAVQQPQQMGSIGGSWMKAGGDTSAPAQQGQINAMAQPQIQAHKSGTCCSPWTPLAEHTEPPAHRGSLPFPEPLIFSSSGLNTHFCCAFCMAGRWNFPKGDALTNVSFSAPSPGRGNADPPSKTPK